MSMGFAGAGVIGSEELEELEDELHSARQLLPERLRVQAVQPLAQLVQAVAAQAKEASASQ